MIPRYTRPEMGRIWSDENKFQNWLDVEIAAAEAEAEAGLMPQVGGARHPRERRLRGGAHPEIEAEVKHDVIAFTTTVAENVGPRSALAALRPDLQRRGGYRAGAAGDARPRPSTARGPERGWARC